MAISIALLCLVTLALVYVPGFRPSAEVLACDSVGGAWSNANGVCNRSDSPLAGLAS